MYLPQFQHGTGALTANIINEVMGAARVVQGQEWTGFTQDSLWFGPRLCEVVDNELMSGETTRYAYSLREVFIDENGDPAHTDGMFTTEGKDGDMFNAFNAAEYCNTATHVQGIAIADLTGTFSLQPIADDTLVWCWFTGGDSKLDTGMVGMFSLQNIIAGECS
tara:strand:+ start:548 stop:1039 length:492 start_codon:yes stop_codon:yes gene_type:complete